MCERPDLMPDSGVINLVMDEIKEILAGLLDPEASPQYMIKASTGRLTRLFRYLEHRDTLQMYESEIIRGWSEK